MREDGGHGLLEFEGVFWIIVFASLLLTMVLSGVLDLFFGGGPLIYIPFSSVALPLNQFITCLIIVLVSFYIGLVGLKELLYDRRFSVEFLMAMAAIGALYLGLFLEAVIVLALYSLSEFLEGYIEDKARETVKSISSLIPDKARVIFNGSETYMDVKSVLPGMVILVKPGERVALDGVVVEGGSLIDLSLVTGESNPVSVNSGDRVYAGALNIGGVIKVLVDRGVEETLVSRIVKLVMDARGRKASINRFIDRFSKYYVPLIISFALLVIIVGPRLIGGSLESWIYKSLILIVLSCPSAFIISIPATIFTAITVAAKRGAIVKGGIYVENLSKIRAVLLDKTGTLTYGFPSIHKIRAVNESDDKILMYAASLERFSNHPIAKAIVNGAFARGLDIAKINVRDVKEFPGMGVIGYVEGDEILVGNIDLMKQYSCVCDNMDSLLLDDDHTSIYVAINRKIKASICFVDEIRSDAVRVVDFLKRLGMKVVLLTGDRGDVAINVAKTVGVDEVYYELLPEDKLDIIMKMKSMYGFVSMVGDGVNDAPALAASDVGIAMGGSVDLASESADVILVKNSLTLIPYLILLSRKTMAIAKQNIVFTIGVKLTLAILGVIGVIPLWFAVAIGDDGITLLALLNILRIIKVGSRIA
ncbi:MAG: cation-translocating P-type ATPase [archaeon YNP-LCB-003-016]|uniref:heavy metal translocating P-type ATPase n=1 Tax=Candidatus Culexarchaeum yellowstonense TaxID=2928963 RepID=UPI0026EE8520|nr:cation-translocating P-type ATPase [Candidatus Culexarchaeum yellowstonense]MCR6691357.1 cation-translocating P-type ATPase [Candidatus Culexarchaeum yellowstonense]